jgi:hypothetical protein
MSFSLMLFNNALEGAASWSVDDCAVSVRDDLIEHHLGWQ